MTKLLRPEAVRGVWFLLNGESDPLKAREAQTFDVMTFGMDGAYACATLKNGFRRQHEAGDYTFDGEFLITRGRNTETYRVNVRSPWRWELEDRRHTITIVRALFDEEAGRPTLAESYARDLRILPLRAQFREFGQSELSAYEIVYDAGGELERPIVLGTLAVEFLDEDWTWLGIMPTVTGVDAKTWGRIAREGFLGFHLNRTIPADHEVTVHVFDVDEIFNV